MTDTDIMNIIKDSYTGIVYNQSKPAEEFLSTPSVAVTGYPLLGF